MKKQSLRSVINSKLKEVGVKNICSYGLRWTSGEERLQVNDVCHYRAIYLRALDEDKKGDIKELSTSLIPALEYSKNKKDIRRWVSYIILHSPFKDCFKTKNLQAAWRYGIQMDVEKSASNVVSALIALREGWEFKNILNNFILLTNNGINEHIAFIVSRMVEKSKDKYMKTSWGGHQVLSALEVTSMTEFIKNGLYSHDEPMKTNKKPYKIYLSTRSEVWTKDRSLESILFEKPSGRTSNGWSKVPYLTEKDFISAAKEVEKELLK